MKQIPKEKILKRIENFRMCAPSHFSPTGNWAEWFIYSNVGELDRYVKDPFYGLREILSSPSEIYLSHNGSIRIGIPVEQIAGERDYHHMTNESLNGDLIKGNFQRKSTMLTTHSFYKDLHHESIVIPASTRFMEIFFGLPPNTFLCEIVEPGYGLRIDSQGQLKDLLRSFLETKISVFINTIDLEKYNDKKRAYVVNGFEI